jgi:DNA-binding protein H-NS
MTKTYAQLAREIAALQASAQKQLAVEAKGAIAKINDMISTYGLTAGDLKFASASATVSRPAKATKAVMKGQRGAASQGAKFSDGQGHQWGGRGPRPAWLREAIAAGRTLESFAVGAAAPAAPVAASPATKVPAKSTVSKRIKSGAGSAKTQSTKTSAAVKSSPVAEVAPPADAATPAVKASRNKVAVKARAGSAAGAESTQAAKPPVKKSPAAKARTAKTARASKAAKKTTSPKTPVAGSEPVVAAKKAAARKAVPSRKKANPKPAARKTAVVESQAPSAPEAVTATAAA